MYSPQKNKFRVNTKKLYEDVYGKVPVGWDIHHILPLRLGGTDTLDNLVALPRDQHALAHLDLYEKYNTVKDLCAYYMLSGRSVEAQKAAASKGGKAAAVNKAIYNRLSGFQLMDREEHLLIASRAGHMGGTRCKELGIGIHVDKETRLEWSRLGGKATVVQHGLLDSERQRERGKRGGPKNKGFIWYTDGISQFKYTKKQQDVEPFDSFIERTGYKRGRK